jgi:HK97 family phage major capsid protein
MEFNEQEKALIGAIETKTSEMLNTKSDAVKAELNKEIEALKSQIENKELKDEVVRVATELKALKEDGKKEEKPNLVNEIKANKDALKAISKGENKEIVLKANTVRASISSNQHAWDDNEVGQLDTARRSAYALFPKVQMTGSNHNGVYRYYDWDAATTVRAAAAIAEGGTFPESTATFIKRSIDIQKIGDTLPVSDEFFNDEAMFAQELEIFLRTNVDIKTNADIVNGNGTAPNIKGIVATVNAYTPVASGITDASIYDLIVKVSENITATGGAKYSPNFAFMNIVDINKMKLKKDANNNYIIPPFVDRAGNQVSGVVVVEENQVTANTMVLGDSRFAKIIEIPGLSVERGFVNAQFAQWQILTPYQQEVVE